MKNILKRILVFSIVLLLLISNVNSLELVGALKKITMPQKNKLVEIYQVKDKKDVIISNNIIDFYEKDPNKQEFIEYKLEQERLEKEMQAKLELKNNVVNFAMQFIGNPYVLGGTSLTNGTDCSGFVQSVFANFGITLPRTTSEQAIVGEEVLLEQIEIGDIVSYGYNGYITHSALYIGDGKIVHASTPELGIRVDNMHIMPIMTIRRVI